MEVDPDRHHATKTILCWRYIPENKLASLMQQLGLMLTPDASQHVGLKASITIHLHQMAEELKPFPVVPSNPMRPEVHERGRNPRRTLEELVNVLRSGDAYGPSHQKDPPDDDEDAVMAIAPPRGEERSSARPVGNTRVDECCPSAI